HGAGHGRQGASAPRRPGQPLHRQYGFGVVALDRSRSTRECETELCVIDPRSSASVAPHGSPERCARQTVISPSQASSSSLPAKPETPPARSRASRRRCWMYSTCERSTWLIGCSWSTPVGTSESPRARRSLTPAPTASRCRSLIPSETPRATRGSQCAGRNYTLKRNSTEFRHAETSAAATFPGYPCADVTRSYAAV